MLVYDALMIGETLVIFASSSDPQVDSKVLVWHSENICSCERRVGEVQAVSGGRYKMCTDSASMCCTFLP